MTETQIVALVLFGILALWAFLKPSKKKHPEQILDDSTPEDSVKFRGTPKMPSPPPMPRSRRNPPSPGYITPLRRVTSVDEQEEARSLRYEEDQRRKKRQEEEEEQRRRNNSSTSDFYIFPYDTPSDNNNKSESDGFSGFSGGSGGGAGASGSWESDSKPTYASYDDTPSYDSSDSGSSDSGGGDSGGGDGGGGGD